MKTNEFDFELPQDLIAQTPLSDRSASKLLVVHKQSEKIEHTDFKHIADYFKAGDVLVRNNTEVIPARLFGIKEETGAHVELLLLKQEDDIWECLTGNARVVKIGSIISFHEGELRAECIGIGEKGIRTFRMIYDGIFFEILEKLGQMPLPPYIHEKLEEKNRYQTIYAQVKGSAAAPTAGLHFTDEVFKQLTDKGVIITEITLHVGLGTFRPMDTETIEEHIMHSEAYIMSNETAAILNQAKKDNRRIISVGTTSTRTLETIYKKYQQFQACSGETDIFIYPGYKWEAVDCIITNFHLPKSTLIMMISSFASKPLIFEAYQQAIEQRYRFFSFGDSMMISND
ncbi:MAG: tRNA preQ1(34) S-adenosylmethionine ribosyltransferase-isomerase QueA [Erysipelotrichaceae bacterium]